MNDNSSRSHSLLTITLSSETPDPEDPQVIWNNVFLAPYFTYVIIINVFGEKGYIRREGRLCLVDLAGSEKTKRTNSKGDTLVEANNINRSLLTLGS